IISIHMWPITTAEPVEYTLAEFTEKYPGYSYRFTEVPYTIGENKTSEDQYCILDGDNLIPCYVKSDGTKYESIPIEKDSEDGISAVGRMPIILVELVDEDGYVIGDYLADMVVDGVVVELKAVSALNGAHIAQLLNYLKATGMKHGLLINFGSDKFECRKVAGRP
ncbi:MAG: GxxExxY protein, partial [Kiritimatiellae bacterium]|nr:GxxExxY protein [Kiritimatiellia bacterium]